VEWTDTRSGEVRARELYDHFIDGQENINQAGNPGYQSEMPRLAGLLRQSRAIP
jgi:hypothetical protein